MSSVANITVVHPMTSQQSSMPTATIALPQKTTVQPMSSNDTGHAAQQSTTVMQVQQHTNPGNITIPRGMVLARSHTGQLVIVSSTTMANSVSHQPNQTVSANSGSVKTTLTTVQNQPNIVSNIKVVSTTPQGVVAAKANVVTASPQQQSNKPATQQSVSLSQDDIVNVSKCRNFLTTLIKLASTGGQTPSTVNNVKKLVQNLIDDKIQPEHFTQQLQIELNSAPQPYLVPFLKRSLPLLRVTMMQQSGSTTSTIPPQTASNTARLTPTEANILSQNTSRRPAPKNKSNLNKSNVPDIKLPRYSGSPTPPRSMTTQQPRYLQMPQNSQNAIHRSPHSLNRAGNQKWSGAAGGAAAGGTFKDDDDINDVASMAGVNLSEESARILATNSTVIGSQVRSCEDTTVLQSSVLLQRIQSVVSKHPQITKLGADFDKYLALAVETRIKDIVEKVSLVAYHRTINFKESEHYSACQDVKTQLKFLLQLDQIERKRHEEMEREVLMRAIKSRSKNEDPEQLRLKQRAREMQQLEMEKMQIRNADETARIAIGPRKKKPKLMSSATTSANGETDYAVFSSTSRQSILKPRLKRINLRDLLFVMETEKEFCKSNVLYSSYLK